MTLHARPVDPVGDLDLLHDWVTQPRARFWGMTDRSRDEVGEVYAYLDSLDTHHAHLVHDDDRPVAIVQTYEPQHDPVGDSYDVQPGDLGIHLFVGPADVPVEGFTGRLLDFVLGWAFADPAVRRVVAEPDRENAASIARATRTGAAPGDVVDLGHKHAQLVFLERATWQSSRSS